MYRHSIRLRHEDVFDVWSSEMDDDSHEPSLHIKLDDGSGGLFVTITPEYDTPTWSVSQAHIAFARQLVEASQAYLAELERAFEYDQDMDEAA